MNSLHGFFKKRSLENLMLPAALFCSCLDIFDAKYFIYNLQRPSADNNHFKIVFAVKCLKTKANVAKKDGWTYEPIAVDIRS